MRARGIHTGEPVTRAASTVPSSCTTSVRQPACGRHSCDVRLPQSDAESYKFIIVAPDSWSAGPSGWGVPLASAYPTFDMLHIQVPP